MAYPDALIYELGAHGIRSIAYDDIDHVIRMREFMADPETSIAELLSENSGH
jgi:predicted ATPase